MSVKHNQFGDVSITWREPITLEEYSELSDFISIWLRSLRRRVEEPERAAASSLECDPRTDDTLNKTAPLPNMLDAALEEKE